MGFPDAIFALWLFRELGSLPKSWHPTSLPPFLRNRSHRGVADVTI
jgi:hypothetical protein